MVTHVTYRMYNRTKQDIAVIAEIINKKDGSLKKMEFSVLAGKVKTIEVSEPPKCTLVNAPNCFLVWDTEKGTAEIKSESKIHITNTTKFQLKYLISDNVNDVNDFRKINESVNAVIVPSGGSVAVNFIPGKYIGVAGPTALHYDGAEFTQEDIVC
ncbi:hypothetical protein [Pantoea ananatis]|uniref:hypothetical protein n=1 Tax=Pantoea ananas TaxID=553 RepID=UPI001EE5E71B|nr:hypothetical protein [Pantoea ananatis]PKC45620.1 hypothetical protein V461_05910 [Pantoea ananatis BRT98]